MDAPFAVIKMTQVMRSHLLPSNPRQHRKGTFAFDADVTVKWQQRRRYVAVFLSEAAPDQQDSVVALGLVIPGKGAGDYERLLDVQDFATISVPIPSLSLRRHLGERYADALNTGPVADSRRNLLAAALVAQAPDLQERIDSLAARVNAHAPRGHAGEIRSHEKDAVGVLLTAFLRDRSLLREAGLVSPDRPFLEAMPDEVAMIDRDWLRFEDWQGRDIASRTRVYEHDNRRLLIHNANAGRVENIHGVDLLYYNQHHGCFVLVQYKKFASEADGWVYRPDDRLSDQLQRMQVIDVECGPGLELQDIRLYPRPCFLKICKPVPFVADSVDLVDGQYLTREHFELALDSRVSVGPRGGRRIKDTTAPRHLNNSTFTTLLAQGWIGSAGTGTEYVREQVWRSLADRGSVVVGAHFGDQRLGNSGRR
jgi:hypothetical protein